MKRLDDPVFARCVRGDRGTRNAAVCCSARRRPMTVARENFMVRLLSFVFIKVLGTVCPIIFSQKNDKQDGDWREKKPFNTDAKKVDVGRTFLSEKATRDLSAASKRVSLNIRSASKDLDSHVKNCRINMCMYGFEVEIYFACRGVRFLSKEY
jgi:hypothetical protein